MALNQETEFYTFNPIQTQKPPLNPIRFNERDDEKERRNKSKDKRIAISLIILSFLASVCVLFGTLYPEMNRAEIDMRPWRSIIQASVKTQGWLIRDRITLVNVGMWRYCYDDQFYDLIEVTNPQFSMLGRRRRSVDNEEEEEMHAVEKRQVEREGDISIRCHPLPNPWKMPYHLKQKLAVTKAMLIIGTVMCILTFLIGILVLITRLPCLKLLLLIVCFLAAVSLGTAIGLRVAVKGDDQQYFNEAMSRTLAKMLTEEFDLNFLEMGINLQKADLIKFTPGVCFVFIVGGCFVMLISTILAELARNLG